MTTTAQRQQDDAVWTTLELTGHETRMLHHVLGVVMEKPGTFGVRGNGSAEVKAILISTAANLRSKLGTPPPPAKPKPAKSVKPTRPAPAPTAEPSTPAVTAAPVPAVAFSAVAPDPRAPETETPAAVPAAETSNGTTKGMKHFLIVYSRTKRRPIAEQEFDSFAEAFGAQRTATTQWSEEDDVETHVISGPNRAVLVSAQPQYFGKRPPKVRS
jgi:hypothetical protein